MVIFVIDWVSRDFSCAVIHVKRSVSINIFNISLWGPEVNPHEEEGGAAPGVAPEHATKEQE